MLSNVELNKMEMNKTQSVYVCLPAHLPTESEPLYIITFDSVKREAE